MRETTKAIAEREIQSLLADKAEMRRIVDEQYENMSIVYDPTATAEQAQELGGECLRAHGIRPENNLFSRGIIAAREEA